MSVYFTPGFLNIFTDIKSAPKNIESPNTTPINVKRSIAVLNILCAPFLSPIAIFSDTSFDIVFGIPSVAIASKNAYTEKPEP